LVAVRREAEREAVGDDGFGVVAIPRWAGILWDLMPGDLPIHIDDVPSSRWEFGEIGAARRRLGVATGAKRLGVALLEIDPGKRSTPPHSHADEDELFLVLAGSGLSYQTYVIPPRPGIMKQPPRMASEPLIRRPMLVRAWLFLGLVVMALPSPASTTSCARPAGVPATRRTQTARFTTPTSRPRRCTGSG